MRTAVMLSGHMRNYVNCAKSLLNQIVFPLQADLFISTWDKLGFQWWSGHSHESYKGKEGPVNESDLRAVYGPSLRSFRIESFDDKQKEFDLIKKRCYSNKSYSMWYKVLDCYNLCKNGLYDLLIRARPDIRIRQFAFCAKKMKRESVLAQLTGIHRVHIPDTNLTYGWNDQFAFGLARGMEQYCMLYESIGKYFNIQHETVEYLVPMHLEAKKIMPVFSGAIRYVLTRTY